MVWKLRTTSPAIPTDGSAADADDIVRLHEGFDFCSSPRLSPDGRRLAWICWNHPNMPWDATELWLAEVATNGSLLSPRRIAGDAKGDVSIIQPQWGPDNTLYCVSDASGWWNLQRWDGERLVPVLGHGCRIRTAPVGILDVGVRSAG